MNTTGSSRILLANTLIPARTSYIRCSIESLADSVWGRQATDWILPILWSIARKYPSGVFGEIGTRSGISTIALAIAARDVGGHVHTIDVSEEHLGAAQKNLSMAECLPYVNFIVGDSRNTDFPEPLDVLFIDGDHSYDGVKADFERHEPNVKKGGIILFHDASIYDGIECYLKQIGGFVIPIEAGLGVYTKGKHVPAGIISKAA